MLRCLGCASRPPTRRHRNAASRRRHSGRCGDATAGSPVPQNLKHATGRQPLIEVAPVWWALAHLCSRSPRCGSQGDPTPPEFRRQLVELVHAGRMTEELAREFEPTAQSIRNRVVQGERNAGRGNGGLTTAEREELNRLRRENRQLRLEREILSKAAA